MSGLEGLDPGSDMGVRITREANSQLQAARDSGHALLRVVADYLLTTRNCFER